MSYILQALKKAEAQRKLGQVPDAGSVLGAAPAPPAPSESGGAGRSQPALWLLLAGSLLVLALGAWWLWPATPAAPAVAAAPAAATQTAPVPVPSPARIPAPPPVPVATPSPPPVVTLAEPAPPSAPTLAPTPAAQPTPSTPAAPRPIEEMPPAQRSALPPLNVGGSIQSERRSERMLVLDGQVRREGEEIVPGWVLEAIEPGHAVLRGGGARWRLRY